MNVSNITTSTITATSRTETTTTSAPASVESSSGGDRAKLSKMGELMSKLQDLESTDPDKAKQVLAKIASELQSKATETGDDKMKELAAKFDQASQTGDLSGLEPRRRSGGHSHHPHPHPQPPTAAGNATASTSPAATETGKLASYADAGHNPMADIEQIIANALQG